VIPLASTTDSAWGAPEKVIEPVTDPVAPVGNLTNVGVVELIVKAPDGMSSPGPLPVIDTVGARLYAVPAVMVPDSAVVSAVSLVIAVIWEIFELVPVKR
jgi:hypothetical protein